MTVPRFGAQACGVLYLGFAILNWMAKDDLIGGIYSRPVAMGNFLHFFTIAMALVKSFSVLPHSAAIVALVALFLRPGRCLRDCPLPTPNFKVMDWSPYVAMAEVCRFRVSLIRIQPAQMASAAFLGRIHRDRHCPAASLNLR